MNTELRNRLEEAAKQQAIHTLAYFAQHNQTPTHFDWADKVKEEYIAGAEYGYKEAIAQAKEILRKLRIKSEKNFDTCYEYQEAFYQGQIELLDQALADFETDMNKLLEEKK